TGEKLSGRVVDDVGKPVAGVMIVADGGCRKAIVTDANGKFALQGLAKGATTLRAHAFDIKQKIEMPIELESDKSDVEVRLKAITLSAQPKPVAVLGMQLTDSTPELAGVYDFHGTTGAVILNPRKDFKRLEIGDLTEGNIFWMVGEQKVKNVREFGERILEEVAKQAGDKYSVRVVYTFENLGGAGTNTQYLKLTKGDVEELKKVLGELKD
ncbi:MAG TPA: carboxypeptidase-like regulatory domain-containing protein, partial [Lacipirellulaceae bacterium]|nr:carboxypeptidase-like regulatory domain-containing protein [Lacipirellulaceae bacterium]